MSPFKRHLKTSRSSAAKLSNLLNNVLNDPKKHPKVSDLICFGYLCLGLSDDRGGKRHASSLTAKVNKAQNAYSTSIIDPVNNTKSYKNV